MSGGVKILNQYIFHEPGAGMLKPDSDHEAKQEITPQPKKERPNNFPFFMKIIPYYPKEDLAESYIPYIQKVKWSIILTIIFLFINIGIIFIFIFNGTIKKLEDKILYSILSISYFILATPLSFKFPFFYLYFAFRDGNASSFTF